MDTTLLPSPFLTGFTFFAQPFTDINNRKKRVPYKYLLFTFRGLNNPTKTSKSKTCKAVEERKKSK